MTRLVFMGTPDFAVPTLKALLAAPDFEVVGAVTQPDRPAGRGNVLQQSPVKKVAAAAGVAVLQPEKLRKPEAFEALRALQPDVIVVAAFGQLLRQNVLDVPRFGCINVHASLLPRWRGAAPIQAAIRAGDAQTGITIMRMDAGLDTGPVLGQRAIPISPDETGERLHDKLAALGGSLLLEVLRPYLQGELLPAPQDDSRQTYAPMLKKEDGAIDWTQPAAAIERQVRAFHPWPGTFTTWAGQTLKVLPGGAANLPCVLPGTAAPGAVIQAAPGQIAVGSGADLFVLPLVQLAGRAAVSAGAFVNGHRTFVGAVLG
jgi:methionyl-tRNA formyltransferase